MTFLLALLLSAIGTLACIAAIAIGWVVIATWLDVREARRKRANERAVRDAIGRIR